MSPLTEGTRVKTRANGEQTVRQVVYVAPDGQSGAVLLGTKYEITEVRWTHKPPSKAHPDGASFWMVATGGKQ